MEEEKSGITLGEIFRVIFSQKWLALLLVVLITVVGTVGLIFIYSPSKEEYVASFRLDLPGGDANEVIYHYPDGTSFHYVALISASTLSEVKNSDEAFSSIDVEKMIRNSDISINEELTVTSTGNQSSLIDRNYTISVKASYFSNSDVARKFIMCVAEYPKRYLSGMNIEYNGALKLYDGADDYSKQIEYLKNQLTFLEEKYDELIKEYGSDFVVENGKTLKMYLDEVKAYGESGGFINLKAELKSGLYVKSEKTLENYRNELSQIKEDLEDAEMVLKAMTSGQQSDAQYATEIVRVQAEKVAALNRKKLDLEAFTDAASVKIDTEGEFAERLDGVYARVDGYTTELKSVIDNMYGNASGVYYSNSNIIEAEGGMGLLMSLILSFVVGLVVSAIVSYTVGYYKRKKVTAAAGESAPSNESQPSATLQQAEAATAEEPENKNK